MENNGAKEQPSSRKQNQYLVVVCVVLLLSVPLIFLFRKQSPSSGSKPATAVNIAALERAVREQPGYSNLINLSVAYINDNQPGRSIPYLKQALAIKPQSAVAHNNLGVAYTMLKNFPLGIEACNKAITLDSSLTLARNNLKWALGERNKSFAIISKMEQTPEDNRDTSFYIRLGLNYYYIGNYEKSITVCREGLAKYPGNVVLINNIGTTLVMKKQYDEAVAEFSKILESEPANQLAKNNIEWAKSEQARDSMLLIKK